MLIARAPMHISLGGEGTDVEAYYAKYGGVVISAAINKYFHAIITPTETDDLQFIATDHRSPFRHTSYEDLFSDSNLALPRTILDHFGIRRRINLFFASEVPPATGLGSSGATAVTMVHACSTLVEQPMAKPQIAEAASSIEIDQMKMPIGRHDFYASAFGGLNRITFTSKGITVEPLYILPVVQKTLERRLMLFFTESFPKSTTFAKHHSKSKEEHNDAVLRAFHDIKRVAIDMQGYLGRGELDEFAQLLHYSWLQRHRFTPGLSTPSVDESYELALQHGALGGKITAGGGGGFLILYCHEEAQDRVTHVLEERGLKRMHFLFDRQGTVVVLLNRANFSNLKVTSYMK